MQLVHTVAFLPETFPLGHDSHWCVFREGANVPATQS